MGVDTTQRMVASALFQPLYHPNTTNFGAMGLAGVSELNHLPPHQLSIISDDSEDNFSARDLIRQASSLSATSELEPNEDKVTHARNKVIFKAPRPSLLMMTLITL